MINKGVQDWRAALLLARGLPGIGSVLSQGLKLEKPERNESGNSQQLS